MTNIDVAEDMAKRKAVRTCILALLNEGGRYTSFQLNRIAGTGDARKRISELREKGYKISDEWVVKGTRCKEYFIRPEDRA